MPPIVCPPVKMSIRKGGVTWGIHENRGRTIAQKNLYNSVIADLRSQSYFKEACGPKIGGVPVKTALSEDGIWA